MPGLWFSAEKIHALLSMQQLLAGLDPGGLLDPHIEPLKERLAKLLESGDHPAADVARRIRILTVAARRYPAEHFQAIAAAVMERRRLVVDYQARGNGAATRREISPTLSRFQLPGYDFLLPVDGIIIMGFVGCAKRGLCGSAIFEGRPYVLCR